MTTHPLFHQLRRTGAVHDQPPRAGSYILALLLIYLVSGNPIIASTIYEKPVLTVLALIFLVALAMRRPRRSDHKHFTLVALLVIIAASAILTQHFPAVTVLGAVTRLVIGFCAFSVIPRFPKVFVDILWGTSLVSLCFWIANYASGGSFQGIFPQVPGLPPGHVVLYHFHPREPLRNSAFFWEPGVFGCYLILALLFLAAEQRWYTKRQYVLRFVTIVAALVTTFSTTAYALLPVVYLLHWKATFHNRFLRTGMALVVISTCLYGFTRLNFGTVKIENQYAISNRLGHEWQLTRWGSLVSDLEQLKEHPVFGWGPDPRARYEFVEEDILSRQGNGFSDFAVKYGLVGLAVFLIAVWHNMVELYAGQKWTAAAAMIVIVGTLNGEPLLNFPTYLGLMFLHAGCQLERRVLCRVAPVSIRDGRNPQRWRHSIARRSSVNVS